MGKFAKLRELVTRARNLESEGRRLTPGSESRTARMVEAEEYRLKALWLGGRITEEEYWQGLAECLDAKQTVS